MMRKETRAETRSGLVAVACGGTGGHLFPGLAVAERLSERGCGVMLLVSPKEIDRRGIEQANGMECVTLPAVGLERGRVWSFLRGFWRSYWVSRRQFRRRPPSAVLAMGGFTSAAPILAGCHLGKVTFLHESNALPGRANRWLARHVDRVFVGFPQAAARFRHGRIEVSGTPVRSRFRPVDARRCREDLGLDADRPMLLVMGGSQGAMAVNGLVLEALPLLERQVPRLQILHLTGDTDFERVHRAYGGWRGRVEVRRFIDEMDVAMGAATVAIGRAGGSVLAEMALMGLPSILVPYPNSANDHQLFNARALADTGAARLLEQSMATPTAVAVLVRELVEDESARHRMREAMRRWHRPDAAERVADWMLERIGRGMKAGGVSGTREGTAGAGEEDRGADVLTVLAREPNRDGRR